MGEIAGAHGPNRPTNKDGQQKKKKMREANKKKGSIIITLSIYYANKVHQRIQKCTKTSGRNCDDVSSAMASISYLSQTKPKKRKTVRDTHL